MELDSPASRSEVSYLSFVVALLTVKHQAGIKRTAKNKKLSERLGQTDTVL
jgi:hypothetical protein